MVGVYLQQRLDHLFTLCADVLVDVLEFPCADLLKQFLLAFRPEGIVALEQDKVEDAERPHVGVDGYMVHFGHNLGSHICRSSAESVDGVRRH